MWARSDSERQGGPVAFTNIVETDCFGGSIVGSSERRKEIKRRRHRRKRVAQLKQKAAKANGSEKIEIANKLRALTPGAEVIIETLALEDR